MNEDKRFLDQVVIILGATGGLGTAFAHAFAAEGARLLLAARSQEKLDTLAEELSTPIQTYSIDITNADSLDALATFAMTKFEQVDVVVNATGVDVRKPFGEHTLPEIQRTLDVNLSGAILLTRAFLPFMRAQGDGTIVHVGGFADGRLAFPYYSVDVASRAGVASFIESINREIKGSGITVTYFSPTTADTEAERPYHEIWREMGLEIASPGEVAEALLDTVARRKPIHIMGGAGASFLAKLNAAWPHLADAIIMRRYGQILKRHLGQAEGLLVASSQAPNKAPWLRYLGLGLVVLSFVLYGGLLLVPCVPCNLQEKAVLSSGLVVSGEAVFWIGGVILGKEVITRYRRLLNPCNWGSK